jgi:ERCC4-type nuclease
MCDFKQHLIEGYTVKPLDCGDFLFELNGGHLIFERKTIGDFMQSLTSHHIHTQLIKMQSVSPYNYIIIVGNINKFFIESEFYTKKQFLGGIANLSLHGAKILFVDNNEQMFELMYCMAEKFALKDRPILIEQDIVFKKREVSSLVKVLMNIETIGVEKAELIAKQYSSLETISLAIEENSFYVNSIGPKSVEKIKKFLDEVL